MPYGRAYGAYALSRGLDRLGEYFGNRQRDAALAARTEEEQRRIDRALRSEALSRPGAMTLAEAAAAGLVANPNELARAGTPEVDVRFRQPDPIEVDGRQVRERSPYLVRPGVVMDPTRARQEAELPERLARAERGRLLGAARPDLGQAAINAAAAGIPLDVAVRPGRKLEPWELPPERQQAMLEWYGRRAAAERAPEQTRRMSYADAMQAIRTRYGDPAQNWALPAWMTEGWKDQAIATLMAGGQMPPAPGRERITWRTEPMDWEGPAVGPPSPSEMPPRGTGERLRRPGPADTAGFGAARQRALQLQAEGKSRQEILQTLRDEGFNVVE